MIISSMNFSAFLVFLHIMFYTFVGPFYNFVIIVHKTVISAQNESSMLKQ
jgi:hypothetical protein